MISAGVGGFWGLAGGGIPAALAGGTIAEPSASRFPTPLVTLYTQDLLWTGPSAEAVGYCSTATRAPLKAFSLRSSDFPDQDNRALP